MTIVIVPTPLFFRASQHTNVCEMALSELFKWRFALQNMGRLVGCPGRHRRCVSSDYSRSERETPMKLHRTVCITAGTLVVLGALLSWFVHPVFVLVLVIAGVGLIMSGLTDTTRDDICR